ncbi:uncharacterized protein M421DRAFT_157215 [Didymella exigua CBS 183.55]|uniref:Uncharacterized protein n=1 Tax=Didymella exigua CBS 183.55 TaxID=1150837 RepID=A0A6A5RPN0_9PLEO|nr:uncharacterized protein M421DRAFT_157215 [Didymella exigua CBS 183.55]KAF1928256.1 hypothetical protein M421DRAFT_157215 [Didymella exigua CBS 183.55]
MFGSPWACNTASNPPTNKRPDTDNETELYLKSIEDYTATSKQYVVASNAKQSPLLTKNAMHPTYTVSTRSENDHLLAVFHCVQGDG